MTKHRDNQPDDDATVWKRLTDGVKAYRPDPPAPIRPKSSPAARQGGSSSGWTCRCHTHDRET
ncbi:MAG: hypothetical protein ACPH14_00495 [Candidatus Puniceispirillaceae bacterium]